jgi:ribosomal protein L7/L12
MLDDVMRLIKTRRKIEAIKVYREHTGCGLKEAKDAIEALERGDSVPSAQPRSRFAPPNSGQLESLVYAGQKIEAIRLYREQTGCGLREAKDAVEAFERGDTASLAFVPPPPPDAQSTIAQIEEWVQRGNKINAIKTYREFTGVGLKIAKDVIDAIGRGDAIGWQARLAAFDLEHIRQLIREGRKLNAVSYYQQQLGLAMGDARAIVDALEAVMAGDSDV